MKLIKTILTLSLFMSIISTYGQVKADTVRLLDPQASTIVLLPDVQNYVKYDYNQPVLELMTAWTKENIKNLNIRAAFVTGDLVDQNESLSPPFPRFGNLSSEEQWKFVAHAFERLDNEIPYFISPGNHDYGYTKSENEQTNYPTYFPIGKNSKWKSVIRASFPGRTGKATIENAAFELKIPHWKKMLVISTEFAPRDEVLDWIYALTSSKEYEDYQVVILTHSYMTWNGTRIASENYKIRPANSGQQIWDKLLNKSRNIKLLICGHYGLADEVFEHTTGFRQDRNAVGNTVSQMMFNTQTLGGGWSGNGGDGWLRLLEFLPDGETIQVRTYSPLFGFSSLTKQHAWRTASYDQFKFQIQ